MPHVIIKLYEGRDDQTKKELADAIAQNVAEIAGCREGSVSVAIEEYDPAAWPEMVYRPDVVIGARTLIRHPDYNPFQS